MKRAVILLLALASCAGASPPAGDGAKTKHWSFQPVACPAPPDVKDAAWPRNPIDRFILARLEEEGIKPSAEAERTTLLRRVYLDLIGLLPSPEETDAFLADSSPDAYERAVDRLLASPHYGERWGRHWLDQARYADSNGFTIDAPRSIWKYRDWVIDALNHDMPFNQFAVEQIAGDLLPNATTAQRVATGFHRNTMINQEGGIDLEQFRVESVVDRVNTVGTDFLGLTIACAQCHDHKYDPIRQREYYQLFAFLNSCDEPELELPEPGQLEARAAVQKKLAQLHKQLRAFDVTTPEQVVAWEKKLSPEDAKTLPDAIQTILKLPDNGRSPDQVEKLQTFYRQTKRYLSATDGFASPLPYIPLAAAAALQNRLELENEIEHCKKELPRILTTLIVQERAQPRETHVMMGGDFLRKGDRVRPGTPSVLPPLPGDNEKFNRLDLARWLVDLKNPLTPRVTVNRIWQRYFGIGLVETDNDFGTQGTPPSHPELLDWLANKFVGQNWSLKAVHRLIVTSATYRQSSRARPELAKLDPRNRLLARQSRLRFEAEIVRDVSLSASGQLCTHVGGPSVFPPQPDGVFRFTQIPREWKPSTGPDRFRRGMYTWFWRSSPHPALSVFDAPDSTTTCTRRNRSNTPLQALTLLNDQASFEFAQALTVRLLAFKVNDAERLRQAYRLCLCREPTSAEKSRLEKLVRDLSLHFQANREEAQSLLPAESPSDVDAIGFASWLTVARVLLNLDEFLTRE